MPLEPETCIGGTVCAGYVSLRARVAELEAAAKDLLDKHPCSDPDCCSTAREESAARDRLQAVLNRH